MIRKRFTVLLLALCVCALAIVPVYAATEKADPQERPVRFKHRFPATMTIEEATQYEQRVGDRSEFAAEAEEDQSFVPATGTGGLVPGEIKNYPIPPNAIYCGETTLASQWSGGPQRSVEHGIDPLSGRRYIHVVWTCLKTYNFSDPTRNVNYNCYDWTIPGWTVSTDPWGGFPICLPGDRCGCPHVDVNSAGNAVLFHHSYVTCDLANSRVTRFTIPGWGIYTTDQLTSLPDQQNVFPRGAIGNETITHHDPPEDTLTEVYHVGAQGCSAGLDDPAYMAYHRYAWNPDLIPPGYEWQGPVPMSQSMTLSHELAADGERVIFAHAHARDYGVARNQYNNDCVYFESTEAGEDWITGGGFDLADVEAGAAWNTTSYVDSDPHRIYIDMSVMFDHDGTLHLLYTTPGYNDAEGTISVGPTIMLHWSEGASPNINAQVSGGAPIGFVGGTDNYHGIAASAMWGSVDPNLANDGSSGPLNRYISKMTLGVGDGSTACTDPSTGNTNEGYLYTAYTLFGGLDPADKEDASASGFQNGNIYISMSNDNGGSWDAGRCLATASGNFALGEAPTRSPGCECPTNDPGDPECLDPCMSEHWGSMARLVNDTLHCFYIEDYYPGSSPFDDRDLNWAVNKSVYHPLIGDGTVDGNLCPMIAPVLGVMMTADPNCEYHGDLAPGLEPINCETLTICNYGNDDLNYEIGLNQLSGGPGYWMLIDGGTSIPPTTILSGGDCDQYEVVMDALETPGKGMYQAEILIDHNDPNPSLANPYVITVSFFVADSFICGEGVVITTPCVALEVSNTESWGRENGEGGMWYYNAIDEDLLYNPVYDASLVIVNKTLTVAGPDTVAYRDIYTNQTPGNPGFRALEDLKLSYNAATNESLGVANQVTVDSLIGITVQYWFPQDPDSCEFVRMKFSIYANTFSDPDLIIGAAADLDVGTTNQDDGGTVTTNGDMGGWVPAYNLIYVQGTELDAMGPGPGDDIDITTQYAAGMTALTCEPVKRAVVQSNRNYVYPDGGYTDQYLFEEFDSTGVTIWVDLDPTAAELDYVDDIHVLLGVKEVTLTEDAWEQDGMHVLHIAMVTSTQAAEDVEASDYTSPYEGYVQDLIDETKKAWKKGFGWCGDFAVNAPLSEANPYPVEAGGALYLNATGTHEDGIDGMCCGCDFSVVTVVPTPTAGSITLVDDGDCRAHLEVSSDIDPAGTYTVTLAVSDLCGDQTDELTFEIDVLGSTCNCGALGDMNADGVAHPMDAIYLVKIVYQGMDCGVYPDGWNCPWALGDMNCDGAVNPLDVTYIIAFIFMDWDVLCDGCSTGK